MATSADRYEEAAAFYRERIARGVAGHADFHNHAVTCYKRGEFELGLSSIATAIERDGEVAQSHYLRGLLLKESGQAGEAVAAFDRAIALAPPNVGKTLYHRGTARFLAGDPTGGLADLQAAVQIDPRSREALFDLAVVAVGARRWETARDALIELLALDPSGREDYARLLCEIGRSEAIAEFYGQAHRIKNRLGLCGNRLRALARDVEKAAPAAAASDDGRLREDAEAASEEVQRLFDELGNMLRAIRNEPLERDLIEPNVVVGRVVFAASAGFAGIEVSRELDPDVPDLVGDPSAVEEALLNVIVNAADAVRGRAGARITIRTYGIEDDEKVVFEIADNGPGIPEDQLESIFRFGYTTKEQGSGVGLAWTDGVVRAHGGRIEVANEPGGGARFRIVLPSSGEELHVQTLSLRSLLFEDLRDLVVQHEKEGGEGLKI